MTDTSNSSYRSYAVQIMESSYGSIWTKGINRSSVMKIFWLAIGRFCVHAREQDRTRRERMINKNVCSRVRIRFSSGMGRVDHDFQLNYYAINLTETFDIAFCDIFQPFRFFFFLLTFHFPLRRKIRIIESHRIR